MAVNVALYIKLFTIVQIDSHSRSKYVELSHLAIMQYNSGWPRLTCRKIYVV